MRKVENSECDLVVCKAIMSSFKIHNIPISEKDLVRFYNKPKAYRTINTMVKKTGVVKKRGRSDS